MFPLVISEVNLVTIVCKCCVVENGLHFFCNLRAEHTIKYLEKYPGTEAYF